VTLLLAILCGALVIVTIVFLLRPQGPKSKAGRRKRVKFPEREEQVRSVDEAIVRATREVVATTIAIGTFASDKIVRDRFPDAVRLHPKGDEPIAERFWSQLYRSGDTYVVVETYAGDARPGLRTESDADLEQGSAPYLARVVLYGALAGDEHVAGVKLALTEGRVKYLMVHVPIELVEGRSRADTIHVADYALDAEAS
jgi:hypothetical protein